jgi:hypothetical protein
LLRRNIFRVVDVRSRERLYLWTLDGRRGINYAFHGPDWRLSRLLMQYLESLISLRLLYLTFPGEKAWEFFISKLITRLTIRDGIGPLEDMCWSIEWMRLRNIDRAV